jgi:saccharopine dehydrogenase-like NADP-dependent oxidoreductase
MRGLREVGFFRDAPMRIGDQDVSPLSLTARLLEQAWAFDEDEEDLTVMWIEVEGRTQAGRETHTYTLLDRYDGTAGVSSMARTTGYTCTAMVRMLAKGLYTRPGITPPEMVGAEPECFRFVMSELENRGVRFHHQINPSEA